ncbi:MAG: hypothetical protein R3C56_34120 [Pirellulaceae bacterium]
MPILHCVSRGRSRKGGGAETLRGQVSDTDRSTAMLKSRASVATGGSTSWNRRSGDMALLVIGLPGTGKSTLARELATQAKFGRPIGNGSPRPQPNRAFSL